MKLPLLGAWAGAVLAALVVIRFDSSYESQTLAGGERLHGVSALAIVGAGFVVGFFADAAVDRD